MWGGEPFIEVLAGKLGGAWAPSSAAVGARRDAAFPLTFDPRFDFSAPRPSPVVGVTEDRPARAGRAGQAPPEPPTAPPRRPRVLTPAERDALDVVNALGARLSPDFSERDLRSAFRLLARRYHPDRHPGCGASQSSRLSRQFACLHAACRVLAGTARSDAPRAPGAH